MECQVVEKWLRQVELLLGQSSRTLHSIRHSCQSQWRSHCLCHQRSSNCPRTGSTCTACSNGGSCSDQGAWVVELLSKVACKQASGVGLTLIGWSASNHHEQQPLPCRHLKQLLQQLLQGLAQGKDRHGALPARSCMAYGGAKACGLKKHTITDNRGTRQPGTHTNEGNQQCKSIVHATEHLRCSML
jgi:hypothetical protein